MQWQKCRGGTNVGGTYVGGKNVGGKNVGGKNVGGKKVAASLKMVIERLLFRSQILSTIIILTNTKADSGKM